MPNAIGKWPAGLLSFLTAKGGQSPVAIGDVLVPTLSAEHFYAARDLETVSASAAGLNAVDTGVNITVTANECWRLWAMSYSVNNVTAASVAAIELTLSPAGGNQVTILPARLWTSTALGSNYRDGLFVPQPVILMPGSVLGAVISQAPAAGTLNIGLIAMIQRMSV